MKKKLLQEGIFIVIVAFIAIYFFGESPGNVAKEMVMWYAILFAVSVILAVYMGWALTRAMNPKSKKEPNDAGR